MDANWSMSWDDAQCYLVSFLIPVITGVTQASVWIVVWEVSALTGVDMPNCCLANWCVRCCVFGGWSLVCWGCPGHSTGNIKAVIQLLSFHLKHSSPVGAMTAWADCATAGHCE